MKLEKSRNIDLKYVRSKGQLMARGEEEGPETFDNPHY